MSEARITELLEAKTKTVSATLTRPDNTTAYTANDVISDDTPSNFEFDLGEVHSSSSILIVSARIRIDIAAVPSGMSTMRAALFNAAPTALADNAAFDIINADKTKFLGYVDINTPVDFGTRIWGQVDNVNALIELADSTLYSQLVTTGAYTPSAEDVVTLFLSFLEFRN
jgi:hypothetical protein